MGSTQSLKFCSILALNLALKNNNVAKNQNFRKNYILSVSPKSQKITDFFCKIKQNNFFGGSKLGLNFPLWSRQRVIRNLHIVYYRNISLNVLDVKFQFLFIFCSHFYLEEALRFPGLGLNCINFVRYWDNNSCKQH